jgi:hypothetical protein
METEKVPLVVFLIYCSPNTFLYLGQLLSSKEIHSEQNEYMMKNNHLPRKFN